MAKASLEQQLAEQQSALDGVLADVSLGIRNQRQFDELEERANDICSGIRAAFRKCQR